MPIPSPTSVAPWYLRDIHQALALDEPSGNVYLRTGFTGNIVIGNVTLPGNIAVDTLGNVDITGPTMPVSGTVTIDTITSNVVVEGSVSVDNFPSTYEVTQGTDPWVVSGNVTVEGNVNATLQGTSLVSFAAENTDAFGRLRVSNPYTLFDTQARYYDHGQFSTEATTGGTVTYDANSSTFDLSVSGALGSSVLRETKRVFPYQPGKSLLVLNTFCMAPLASGITQRVGFYGAQNGVYFEAVGSTLNLVIRSYSGGSLVENRIPQSLWNGDKLNGTGPSGITLHPDRSQILWMDIEWLGVGSVRCGFVINGTFYTCHKFNHANTPGFVSTYMTTATLPIRYEIFNTASTGVPATMKQICSSVISEGGYNNFGTTQTAGTGTTTKNLTTKDVYYPVCSIRLAPTRLDSIVLPRQLDILSPSVNYYRWTLLQNAVLTGATWSGISGTGSVQIDTSATAVSGGTELQSGFASARELSDLGSVDFFQFQLGRTLAGVSDTVTLAIAALANNADVLAELGWQELT
jgi:hypothetical protein